MLIFIALHICQFLYGATVSPSTRNIILGVSIIETVWELAVITQLMALTVGYFAKRVKTKAELRDKLLREKPPYDDIIVVNNPIDLCTHIRLVKDGKVVHTKKINRKDLM